MSPGVFDTTVLDAIENVMAEAKDYGMKTILSIHDGNAFGQNSNAIEHFDNGTRYVLTYESPSLKKPLKECTEYIMAFDIEKRANGSEPGYH